MASAAAASAASAAAAEAAMVPGAVDWSIFDDAQIIEQITRRYTDGFRSETSLGRQSLASFMYSCVDVASRRIASFYIESDPLAVAPPAAADAAAAASTSPQFALISSDERKFDSAQTLKLIGYLGTRGIEWDASIDTCYTESSSSPSSLSTDERFSRWLAKTIRDRQLLSILTNEPGLIAVFVNRWHANLGVRTNILKAYLRLGVIPAHIPLEIPSEDQSSTYTFLPDNYEPDAVSTAYAAWRAVHLVNEAFVNRVTCACTFMTAREASSAPGHMLAYNSNILGNDFMPWSELDRCVVGFNPLEVGYEASLVFDTKIRCAEVIAKLRPGPPQYWLLKLGINVEKHVNEREVRRRERVAREAVSTVAMGELNYEHDIPLDLVNLIAGFVHPWLEGAPVMVRTPAQQAQQDAFANAHGGT
jgi:hypothetical protein